MTKGAEGAVLEARALTRRFGGLTAVDDVSFTVGVGQLHAVIGPNGAGKSTLVNLLTGEIRPSAGEVRIAGQDATGWPPWRVARAGVGRTFQRTDVLREASALENVRLAAAGAGAAAVRGWRRWLGSGAARRPLEAARVALDRAGLADRADDPAGTLSHGQLRQLEVAMALATDPRALLLDEPLAGMGPEEAERMTLLLRGLARDHALLLIEHDMDVVFAVADTVMVMVDGRVLAAGTPAEIRESAAVRDAYLGHG